MNKLLLILAGMIALQTGSAAELIDLTSTDGRTISVLIDNYNTRKDEVSVRLNGTGRLMAFKLDRLDKASQESVKEWHKLYSVVKSLTIRTERLPAKDRSQRIFDIELSSSAETDIENLRIEYSIPFKETSMVEREDTQYKYDKVSIENVITGSIDVGTLAARKSRHVNTESVTISNEQTITIKKGTTKDVTNSNSIKGILLKIYVGDQMVREFESQNGVKQLIEKYSK